MSRLSSLLKISVLSALIAGSSCYAADREVNVFYYDLSNTFISNFSHALEGCAEQNNVTLNEFNAAHNSLKQNGQIDEAMLGKHPLLINLVEANEADEIIENAKDNSQRVVFFNRVPSASSLKHYQQAWYVGSNPSEAGVMQAKMILDYIKTHPEIDRNKDKEISMVLLKGEKSHQDTIVRSRALLDILKTSNIKIRLIAEAYSDWSHQQGYEEMKKIISLNGINNIELIVANNDALVLGAIDALNESDFNTGNDSKIIPTFGIDAIPQALKAISEGKLSGTLLNDSEKMAKVALQIATSDTVDNKELTHEVGYSVNEDGYVMIPYSRISR